MCGGMETRLMEHTVQKQMPGKEAVCLQALECSSVWVAVCSSRADAVQFYHIIHTTNILPEGSVAVSFSPVC